MDGQMDVEVSSPLDIRGCHDQGWQTNKGKGRGLGPEHRQCTIVCAECSNDTKRTTSCCEMGVSYFSVDQTFCSKKLERWSPTSESIGGEASKRNDGKAERADNRKRGAQSTNAVNIPSVEQRCRPCKR